MANRKLKCKWCSEYFPRESIIQVPAGRFCSHGHAIEFATNRARKAREARIRKEITEAKERLKTLSDHLREAQQAFNAFIRERDKSMPCISCQRHHSGQYHAGHYLTVKARPGLRFDELNVHKQCSACNTHLSGNLVNYRINLINKIGLDEVEKLESDHKPKRYRIDDAKRIKEEYRAKLRELKRKSNT